MAKNYKNRSKFPAMITYIIAVLSLLVGLILPLSTKTLASGINFNNMPVLQLTGAIAALGLINKLPFGIELTSAYSFDITLFKANVNVGAILLLAYAFVTVLALIFLIPVCVAKRKKPLARKLAMLIEIIALTVLLAMAAHEFAIHTDDWNLSILIPFGMTLLMLILQSIIYFKGSGVIKTITFLISAIALIFAVYNVSERISALSNPINNLLKGMQGKRPFETVLGLYSIGDKTYFGGMLLTDWSLLIPKANPEYAAINIIAVALSVLVCINVLLNMFGLGKRTNALMLAFNLARYIIEMVLIVALYGTVFWFKGNFGLCLYLITALAIIQLIIAIVRFTTYKKVVVSPVKESDEEVDEDADVADSDDEYAFAPDEAEQPAEAETAATTAPAEPATTVVTVYNGPTDAFIQKLSTEQKVEFEKLFIERNSNKLNGIPNYIVGGDNSKFFSALFIYLARIRDLVSDGLMNKLYEEVHLLA